VHGAGVANILSPQQLYFTQPSKYMISSGPVVGCLLPACRLWSRGGLLPLSPLPSSVLDHFPTSYPYQLLPLTSPSLLLPGP
jgi:hypothetical protein